MNFDTFQQSWFPYNEHNQGMASDCPSTVWQQDTTNSRNGHFIDLDALGRQTPVLSNMSQRVELLNPREQRTGFQNCGNYTMEKNNPEAMMCLTGFTRHTIDSSHTKQDLPRKRLRTTFSPSQLKRLESEFRCNMYVVGLKRQRLAHELQLEERHIKIWFQNRRMKFKRDQRLHERNVSMAYQNFCFY